MLYSKKNLVCAWTHRQNTHEVTRIAAHARERSPVDPQTLGWLRSQGAVPSEKEKSQGLAARVRPLSSQREDVPYKGTLRTVTQQEARAS
jgi:hypothetical protein